MYLYRECGVQLVYRHIYSESRHVESSMCMLEQVVEYTISKKRAIYVPKERQNYFKKTVHKELRIYILHMIVYVCVQTKLIKTTLMYKQSEEYTGDI